MIAPIALFVYNRLKEVQLTVESLRQNKLSIESELFIFCDAADSAVGVEKVNRVRSYLKSIEGFKAVNIVERDRHLGLAQSIISGVTEIVGRYGKIIVLEDDLVTSPYFLQFMNDGLRFYENEDRIAGIYGYTYPFEVILPETFLLRGADSLGWATWKRGWDLFEKDGVKLLKELKEKRLEREFNFNNGYNYTKMLEDQVAGRNDSWAVRWYASVFLTNKLTLYSGKSLVRHIGYGGTNFGFTNVLDVNVSDMPIKIEPIKIEEHKAARKEFENYFYSIKPSIFMRLNDKIIRVFCQIKNKF